MNKPVFKEKNIPMKTGLFIIYGILAYKNLVFAVNLRNTNNSAFRIPNSEFKSKRHCLFKQFVLLFPKLRRKVNVVFVRIFKTLKLVPEHIYLFCAELLYLLG